MTDKLQLLINKIEKVNSEDASVRANADLSAEKNDKADADASAEIENDND